MNLGNLAIRIGLFSSAILPLLLLACTAGVDATGHTPKIVLREDKPVLVLPESLTSYIKTQYPSFRVPNAEDMTGGWATYLDRTDAVPYATWGDFNGDGLTDVALILIGQDRWKNVAFHQTAEHIYEAERLGKFPGPDKRFVRVHPPQRFILYTLKAGEKLKFGEEFDDISQHQFDSIAFGLSKDPTDVVQYKWAPEYNFYSVIAYGGMTD